MSYPISSMVRDYRPQEGYEHVSKAAIVPHGLSVILTAPAVFKVLHTSSSAACTLLLQCAYVQWTCSADPERHFRAAELLGKFLFAY